MDQYREDPDDLAAKARAEKFAKILARTIVSADGANTDHGQNAFLDSELEQVLCFDTAIDAEKFCSEKCAVFLVLPEENPTTYFLISLIIQQIYREILTIADENGGRLQNRVVFFCDELGTLPPIQSLEIMLSASRSRRLSIVPIIQSFGQLQKNYGKEGAEIIVDNCQLTVFGGFAPNSETAEILSKSLGTRTVLSGSVSRSRSDPSQSLQMMERPLMTADELKALRRGSFIVTKTGFYPMRTVLRLFLEWGITFDRPYTLEERAHRRVAYADKDELEYAIHLKYRTSGDELADGEPTGGRASRGGGMAQRRSRRGSAVRRELAELVEHHYIACESRCRPNGACSSNLYTVL